MPQVSVIVPVYNTEPYLRKCLDSLLGQTLQDIEVITVDDGSTDGSAAVLAEYAGRHGPKLKVLSQKNAGAAAARNSGIEAAAGEYLAFVDSDDWMDVEFLETLLTAARANDADVVDCEVMIAEERPEGFSLRNTTDANPALRRLWESLKPGSLQEEPRWLLVHPACVWNKIYKADLFKSSDIRFPPLRRHQDFATTPRVLSRARRIVSVRKPLCYYRQREDSISRSVNDAWKGMYKVLAILKEDFSGRFEKELSFLAAARLVTGSSVQAIKDGCSNADLVGIVEFMDKEFPSWRTNPYIATFMGSKGRLILGLMKLRAFGVLRLLVDGKRMTRRILGRGA